MKNLSKIIFVFVLGFLFLGQVSAKNYKVSCDYVDPNELKSVYVITFEMNGDTLKIVNSTKDGKSYPLDWKEDDWQKGKECPSFIDVNPSDTTSIRLYHHWTWDCKYSINDGRIEKLTLKYSKAYNLKIWNDAGVKYERYEGEEKIENFEFEMGTITIDDQNKNKMDNYTNKCIPISISYSGSTATITFSDDGEYQGDGKPDFNKEVLETTSSSCLDYKTNPSLCRTDSDVACIWVENEESPNGGFCNVDNLLYVGCGGASDIPKQVPALISMLVNLLKIATPIILIFISIITLVKAMSAQKDDEIKKAQSSLIKKIIAAALVFFVVAIVQFIVSKVAEDEEYEGFSNCLNCFLNNKCEVAQYYKTVVNGEDFCTPLTTGKTTECEDLFN